MVWKKALMCLSEGHFCVATVSWLFQDLIGKRFFLLNSRWVFEYLFQHFNDRFPKHIFFANLDCLRCGACCSWDWRHAYRNDIKRWILESRYDILRHVDCSKYSDARVVSCASRFLHYDEQNPCGNCHGGNIIPIDGGKCPFVMRVANKPYYTCRIHDTKPEECSEHLCEKSLPVVNLDWNSIEELIQKIGIERYKSLIK